MKNAINLDQRTFLVTFYLKSTNQKFIFNTDVQLMYLIKNHELKGIEKIQEFNTNKNSFQRINKKNVISCLSNDTQATFFLKQHAFFN